MPDQAGGWRHPGWSWTARHEQLTSAGYGVATLLAGGVLGIVPSLVTGDWKSLLTWVLLWVCVGLSVIAMAALGFSEITRRGKDRMLARNGTAYIIYEDARFWTPQDVTRFRESTRRQFARRIQVPGPVEVERGWDWSLDAAARDWDSKVGQLVRAFRVLSIDESRDGKATPNGVFIWAWWAVAAAFGMRVTAADRGLELDVWQRPSNARAGEVNPQIWAQRPHRFGTALLTTHSLPSLTKRVWNAELTVSRRGRPHTAADGAQVSVLLVRFNSNEWGPIPKVVVPFSADHKLDLRLHDAAGVIPVGVSRVAVHELLCVSPESQFPWEDFPALVAEAAAWIEQKAEELADHTLLIGALMPQEVGLGIGILAGRESRRAGWPRHLWPIIREPAKGELVVPRLDLGSAAVDPVLANGRGG